MKLTPILLIPLLFLSSCTIDWNDEKDKKIAELEKQIQNDTFKKKQECITYKDKILENGKGGYINSLSLKEIFYSPKRNSCIFTVTDDNLYSIHDYLNNIIIEQYSGPFIKCGGINKLGTEEFKQCSKEIEDIFNKRIKELKGE